MKTKIPIKKNQSSVILKEHQAAKNTVNTDDDDVIGGVRL